MSCTPGTDIATITDLTHEKKGCDSPSVSDQLLLAVFWDAALFNQIQELGGTAVGFGQRRCRMLESLVVANQRTIA